MRLLPLLALLFILFAILWPVQPGRGASQTLNYVQGLAPDSCNAVCRRVHSRTGVLQGMLLSTEIQADMLRNKVIFKRTQKPRAVHPNRDSIKGYDNGYEKSHLNEN